MNLHLEIDYAFSESKRGLIVRLFGENLQTGFGNDAYLATKMFSRLNNIPMEQIAKENVKVFDLKNNKSFECKLEFPNG